MMTEREGPCSGSLKKKVCSRFAGLSCLRRCAFVEVTSGNLFWVSYDGIRS